MRIALGLEYDGAAFSGWQAQDGVTTVQQVVEAALAQVADAPVRVSCAGRTDAGVHALAQVVHFDTEAQRKMRSWAFGANANLPKHVAVHWAQPVSEDFHARFSALRRQYRYVILNRPIRPTLLSRRVAWAYRPLDEHRMAAAAQYLLGEHDFSAYRASQCQAKHPVRTVYRLEIKREGAFVVIDIVANGFLHHMVRNIAGVLISIGSAEHEPEWARRVLEGRERTLGGVTAPPHGLYFVTATYPERFAVPQLSPSPMLW